MTDELEPGFEILPSRPRRSHGKLITSVAAVVVLAAGGAVSYVAFAAGNSGASTPTQAVQNVVADLQKADLLSVLDDLAPGERDALTAPIRDDIASLKRLKVLAPSANPSSVTGVHFAAHDLTYGKTITVNDHVQIVPITGGSIDLNADAAKLPFTQRFLTLGKARSAASQHVDITTPVRIAAQKVGGTWYASLFYTAADDAAHHAIPTPSDRVAPHGADSPQDAVGQLVRSLLGGDVGSALALVSPVELDAVHDYGTMLMKSAHGWRNVPIKIKTLDLTTTPISKGVRVGLKQVVLAAGDRQFSVAIDGGCATISALGIHRKVCPADAADLIAGLAGSFGCLSSSFSSYGSTQKATRRIKSFDSPPATCHGPTFTAAQKQAIGDLLSGITSFGVDTAQVDGKWFITPARTLADEGATVLSALKGDDLFQLASLGR